MPRVASEQEAHTAKMYKNDKTGHERKFMLKRK